MTNMSDLFFNAGTFNQDISSWDTSRVTNMYRMLTNTTTFNNDGSPNIGYWDTSMVTNMNSMFIGSFGFNQNIGSWNTSKVIVMNAMFMFATAFNNGGSSDIGKWNTAKVENMTSMFGYATAFNQNISTWNVGLVTPIPPPGFSNGASALTLANMPPTFRLFPYSPELSYNPSTNVMTFSLSPEVYSLIGDITYMVVQNVLNVTDGFLDLVQPMVEWLPASAFRVQSPRIHTRSVSSSIIGKKIRVMTSGRGSLAKYHWDNYMKYYNVNQDGSLTETTP